MVYQVLLAVALAAAVVVLAHWYVRHTPSKTAQRVSDSLRLDTCRPFAAPPPPPPSQSTTLAVALAAWDAQGDLERYQRMRAPQPTPDVARLLLALEAWKAEHGAECAGMRRGSGAVEPRVRRPRYTGGPFACFSTPPGTPTSRTAPDATHPTSDGPTSPHGHTAAPQHTEGGGLDG